MKRRDDHSTRQGTKSWTQTMLDKHGKSPHIRHEDDEQDTEHDR